MISYLESNKEWIFSGIGIAIIGFAFKILSVVFKNILKKIRFIKTPETYYSDMLHHPFFDICFDELSDKKIETDFVKNCSIKNHKLLIKKLNKELVASDCLIWIDLDKFTQINNFFGRECGDEIINTILKILYFTSKNIECYCKCKCKIYHALNRDEFFIIISNSQIFGLKDCAQEFVFNINQFNWSEIVPNMFVTCCAGISNNSKDPMNTIRRAKASLELIKMKGGKGVGPEISKLHPYKLVNIYMS